MTQIAIFESNRIGNLTDEVNQWLKKNPSFQVKNVIQSESLGMTTMSMHTSAHSQTRLESQFHFTLTVVYETAEA
jgi:hypothetical protein